MSYRHDIFVSYKWNGDVKTWVENVLVPIMENVLDEIKDRYLPGDIFHDVKQTLFGASVPEVLRDGVAHSKCMICVFTKNYFTNSYWCPAELSAMLRREDETEARNNDAHVGLVFPIIFVDERRKIAIEQSPIYTVGAAAQLVGNILTLRLDRKRYFCVAAGFLGTEAYDELRFAIYDWLYNSIYRRLSSVPDWNPKWRAAEYFESRFNAPQAQGQISHYSLPTLCNS